MNAERKFGIIISIAYLIFLLIFFDYDIESIALAWYSPLVLLGLFTTFWPKLLVPIRTVWLYLGHLLGIINSTIILSVIYFVIITPTAVLRRIFTSRKARSDSNWISNSLPEKWDFRKQY